MPDFLTDEWFDALAEAAASSTVDPSITVAVRQVVDDVSWTVRIAGGKVTVDRDPEGADVTLTTDRQTAEALARGEVATQDAFAGGRLRLGGDLSKLLQAAPAMPRLTI